MKIQIAKYGAPITDDELHKIKDIFIQSHCPKESLINTFGNAHIGENLNSVVIGDSNDKSLKLYYKEVDTND